MENRIGLRRLLAFVGATVLIAITLVALTSGLRAEAQSYTNIPTADLTALRQEIQRLQSRVSVLENQVQSLQSRTSLPPTTHLPPTDTTPRQNVVIDQNGSRGIAGWDFYFTGRGFAPYEQILISSGGVVVRRANADGGGNFSSGGILLPLGTSTFTFTGEESGISAVASVVGVRDATSSR